MPDEHETVKAVALIGCPFDENSSYLRGASEAPPAIRRALYCESSNLWTESGWDLADGSILRDAGDLDPASPDINGAIAAAIGELLAGGDTPIVLGGDHSITYPILKAYGTKYQSLTVLHFDAHPDLYPEFQGNRWSHASPFARAMEEKLADRLIQIGIRTLNDVQRQQARRFGVEITEMKDLQPGMDLRFAKPLYVSIDLDVLDPAFAPGVSHPEPGGMSTRQLLELIRSIRGRVVGADLVELNPRRDPTGISAMVCAKILKEMAAKILEA